MITGATSGGARIPGLVVCEEWSDYLVGEPVFKKIVAGILIDHQVIGLSVYSSLI